MNDLYNPCDDGFVAKVWECFRRNSEVRRHLEEYCEPDAHPWAYAHGWTNPFADSFFGALKSPAEGFSLLERTWTRLRAKERARLSNSLKPDELEPIHSIEVYDEWMDVRMTMLTHFLIAVPRTVLDTKHKKSLVASLSRLLPEPLADARWTKPRGRLLGSKRKWRSFLLAEDWKRLGVGKDNAINLTAFEIYSGNDYGSTAKQRLSNIQNGTKKRHKRFSKVYGDVSAIEACIASVYPEFTPKAAV